MNTFSSENGVSWCIAVWKTKFIFIKSAYFVLKDFVDQNNILASLETLSLVCSSMSYLYALVNI